jgi:O-antigen/teichoic acid export membrane protein
MNRTKRATLNVSITLITQIVSLILKFGVQSAFIYSLSKEYLGLNGLFSNVLSFLNFADLGIGTAITAALYKPIAEHDELMINKLMVAYRKIYMYIASGLIVIGVLVSFFVNLLINDSNFDTLQVAIWFILYMLGTAATYFSAYKRSFLMASQLTYISVLNDFTFKFMQQVAQIVVLFMFHNYTLFIVLQLGFALASNIQLNWYVGRRFGNMFVRVEDNKKAVSETFEAIKKNVFGAISSKIGSIIVFGTDNILISLFLGLVSVAKYSNYMLVVNSLNFVFSQVLNSLVGGFGNLNSTADAEHKKDVLYRVSYLNAILNVILTIGLGAGLSGFIYIWAGESFVFSNTITFFLVLNFSVNQLRYSPTNFISGFGLFWPLRWKSLIEAGVNLIASLILLVSFKLGIVAVIAGTLISNLVVNLWWEPYILYKWNLRTGYKNYMIRYIFYLLFSTLALMWALFINNVFHPTTLIALVFTEVLAVSVGLIVFILITHKMSEFSYVVTLVKKIIRGRKKCMI